MQVSNEELLVIHQAKLVDPLDASQWTEMIENAVAQLLSAHPLQSLTKSGRLCVVMSIVGSGRTDLFAPTVLAVLACDWSDHCASLNLLEEAVRHASLRHIRSSCDSEELLPLTWSRRNLATKLEEGVRATVAIAWKGLGIEGIARERVEKAGRELRGLAGRCRGASDRSEARELTRRYLESKSLEAFAQALVAWGQGQLRETEPTINETALRLFECRETVASRSAREGRAGVPRNAGKASTAPENPARRDLACAEMAEDERAFDETTASDSQGSSSPVSPLAVGPEEGHPGRRAWGSDDRSDSSPELRSRNASGGDDAASPDPSGRFVPECSFGGDGGGKSSGNLLAEQRAALGRVEGRSNGALGGDEASEGGVRSKRGVLALNQKVFARKDASDGWPALWWPCTVYAIRGDGTYNIRYTDGKVDRAVRRMNIIGAEGDHIPSGMVGVLAEVTPRDVYGFDDDYDNSGRTPPQQKKRVKLSRYDGSPLTSSPERDTRRELKESGVVAPITGTVDRANRTLSADTSEDSLTPMANDGGADRNDVTTFSVLAADAEDGGEGKGLIDSGKGKNRVLEEDELESAESPGQSTVAPSPVTERPASDGGLSSKDSEDNRPAGRDCGAMHSPAHRRAEDESVLHRCPAGGNQVLIERGSAASAMREDVDVTAVEKGTKALTDNCIVRSEEGSLEPDNMDTARRASAGAGGGSPRADGSGLTGRGAEGCDEDGAEGGAATEHGEDVVAKRAREMEGDSKPQADEQLPKRERPSVEKVGELGAGEDGGDDEVETDEELTGTEWTQACQHARADVPPRDEKRSRRGAERSAGKSGEGSSREADEQRARLGTPHALLPIMPDEDADCGAGVAPSQSTTFSRHVRRAQRLLSPNCRDAGEARDSPDKPSPGGGEDGRQERQQTGGEGVDHRQKAPTDPYGHKTPATAGTVTSEKKRGVGGVRNGGGTLQASSVPPWPDSIDRAGEAAVGVLKTPCIIARAAAGANRRINTAEWGKTGGRTAKSHDRENNESEEGEGEGSDAQDDLDIVDRQQPRRPPKFTGVRGYGSGGVSRVKRSMKNWFYLRQPAP